MLNMNNLRLSFIILLSFFGICRVSAVSEETYDFIFEQMRYKITSYKDRTVEFVAVDHSYSGPNWTGLEFVYKGDIVIPETVNYEGYEFVVTSFGKECCAGHPCTSIVVPSTVHSIGDGSFVNCCNLTSVEIPHGVKLLGDDVFEGCVGLTDIVLPETVEAIGYECFRETSISSFVCPDSLRSIGAWCFYDCKSLTNVVFNDSLSEIGDMAFSGVPLTELQLPKNLKSIGTNAFQDTKIKTVTIPDKVAVVQGFQGCKELEEVILPDSVLKITNFAGCVNLRKMDMKHCSYLNCISSYSFSAAGLKKLEFPDTVYRWDCEYTKWGEVIPGSVKKVEGKMRLESRSFSNMNLDTLVLTNAVSTISGAFEGTTIKELFVEQEKPMKVSEESTFTAKTYLSGILHVPDGSKEIYSVSPIWENFVNIVDDIVLDCPSEGQLEENGVGVISLSLQSIRIESFDGVIVLCGLKDDVETVVYDVWGNELVKSIAVNGTVTFDMSAVLGNVVVIKVGDNSIKVVVK